MDISMRSMLTAGVTAITAASIVAAPTMSTTSAPQAVLTRAVDLSAAVQTLTRQEVTSALAEIGKFTTSAAATAAPAASANAVISFNAASDAVINAYNFVLMYTDYFALQLAPYVLQFVPFGFVITNQIYAIYPPITDVTDSVVYDLVAPVLNDPLNLAVWANGISAVTYTSLASLLNVGINEVNLVINYFLGFIPPLPPIPPWPFLAAPATAAVTAAAAVAAPTLRPGVKPAAGAVQAALGRVKSAVSDVATTAKTVVDTAVADIAGVATPAQTAAPDATAVGTEADVTPDTDVTPPHPTVSKAAKAPGLATAAVSGAKKAPKNVTKAGKAAKADKSAGSTGGGE
jgi:hypothetical protein